MAHTSNHGPSAPDQNVKAALGYETRDIALNTLSRWLIGLFTFIAVATFGSLGLYKLLVPTYAETERVSPLEHIRTYPPNPQLQARPKRDMIEYRAAEAKIENGYTKGDKGTVNLPIDRAIDLMVERGISGVKGSQAAAPGTAPPQPSADNMPGDATGTTSRNGSTGTGGSTGNTGSTDTMAVTPPGPGVTHTSRP